MRLLVLVVFAAALAACAGPPNSGYPEPRTARPEPPTYGEPTPGTTAATTEPAMTPYSVGY